MSESADQPERRFLMRDSYAVKVEYQKSAGRFVFLLADGTTETIRCAGDPAEKIETFIADLQTCVSVHRLP